MGPVIDISQSLYSDDVTETIVKSDDILVNLQETTVFKNHQANC